MTARHLFRFACALAELASLAAFTLAVYIFAGA